MKRIIAWDSSEDFWNYKELDIPAGRHDGMVQGKRYFKCQPSHGLFVPIRDALALLSKKIPGKNV